MFVIETRQGGRLVKTHWFGAQKEEAVIKIKIDEMKAANTEDGKPYPWEHSYRPTTAEEVRLGREAQHFAHESAWAAARGHKGKQTENKRCVNG